MMGSWASVLDHALRVQGRILSNGGWRGATRRAEGGVSHREVVGRRASRMVDQDQEREDRAPSLERLGHPSAVTTKRVCEKEPASRADEQGCSLMEG
jgi:hypothetical protein